MKVTRKSIRCLDTFVLYIQKAIKKCTQLHFDSTRIFYPVYKQNISYVSSMCRVLHTFRNALAGKKTRI